MLGVKKAFCNPGHPEATKRVLHEAEVRWHDHFTNVCIEENRAERFALSSGGIAESHKEHLQCARSGCGLLDFQVVVASQART